MASRGINKVILIGNLGSDPEVRYMPSGESVVTLSLATNEVWKDKETGENRERAEWHRVVIFRRLAEIASQYLRRGSKIYIEGRLRTRKWQDQSGQDRYTTEIVGDNMQMLDNRADGGGSAMPGAPFMGEQSPQMQTTTNAAATQPTESPTPVPASAGSDDFDDDIPF